MSVRRFRPMTAGTRFRVLNGFEELTQGNEPERSLTVGANKRSGGRDHSGKMTQRNIGGGHKRRYRIIDFRRDKFGVPGVVASVEYDPNRSAFIALLNYVDGEKRYILAPIGIKVGQHLVSGSGVPPEIGNAMPIGELPLGTVVHNIELKPGKGGALARSAGSSAQYQARDGKYGILKMPSGETRMILLTCMATVGTCSNPDHMNVVSGKAGRSRWLGMRPRVRGVAMNPVDHPMGGGEGRASGGHPRSRKGLLAKGFKTRNNKKKSSNLIIKRRTK